MKNLFGYFKRPVGAAADVRELEYLSALHQTCKVLRDDATISATDVRIFLRSRFGIQVTETDAIDIVKGLSGTARLPLPGVEKKGRWFRRNKKAGERPASIPEDVELGESKSSKLCCRKQKDSATEEEENQESDLLHAASQWKSLRKGKIDTRKSWQFSTMNRARKKEMQTVEELVRFDLVNFVSILLIPTLLRLERDRFAPPKEPPGPPHRILEKRNLWHIARFGAYILNLPFVWIGRWKHRRLAAIKEELRPKRATLFLDVLKVMCSSLENEQKSGLTQSDLLDLASSAMDESTTTYGSYFPELKQTVVTKALVRKLLVRYGAEEAAEDDNLVEEMVNAAGGSGAILDERGLASALTSDVNLWPIESEDDATTTFYDVYGFSPLDCNTNAASITPEELLRAGQKELNARRKNSSALLSRTDSTSSFHLAQSSLEAGEVMSNVDESAQIRDKPRRFGKIPKFLPIASYVDYAADQFRSLMFVVFLFLFYTAVSIFLVAFLGAVGFGSLNCEQDFLCKLANTVWHWLSFALLLSLGGVTFLALISLGNHQFVKSGNLMLVAFITLTVIYLVPFIEIFLVDYVGIEIPDEWRGLRNQDSVTVLLCLFAISGALTYFELLRGFVGGLLRPDWVRQFGMLRLAFLPSNVRRAETTKRAATYKMNAMVENAHKLHRRARKKAKGRNADDETMLTFVLHGERFTDCGGFFWTWRETLWSGLIKREGIWIQSKLVVGQVLQVIIVAAVILLWIEGTEELAQSAEEKRDSIVEEGGLLSDYMLDVVPEPWMIYWSFYPGGVVTFVMAVLLLALYYPSTVSTVFKFRSGFTKSLQNPTFQGAFRAYAGNTYYNLGNILYALLGSMGLFFIIFAGALFLLYWPITRDFMTVIAAWGIGLGITCCLKMAVTRLCRSRAQKALYRKRPVSANFNSLALEAWHLALGGGVLVGRLCQILLAAAFWIGRIDSRFLNDGVEVFGYRFDTVSLFYVSEILVHEAHRHPFLERMAAMYLMRLKYGEYFGTDAGAAWRSIFVLALFPWLLKYRQGTDEETDDEEEDEDFFPIETENTEGVVGGGVEILGNVPWEESKEE